MTWIPVTERLPRREDADELGDLTWRDNKGSIWLGNYEEVFPSAAHWHPLSRYSPPAPPEPEIGRVWVGPGHFHMHGDPCRASNHDEFVEVAPLVEAVKAMYEREYAPLDTEGYVLIRAADVVKLIEGKK